MTRTRMHSMWTIRRTGSAPPEPGQYVQRAARVGSLVKACGPSTILLTNTTGEPVVHVIIPASGKAPMLAESIASAVGGSKAPVTELPELNVDSVLRLRARPGESAARDVQAGKDPSEVAAVIGSTLPVGAWCAVSMRAPRSGERKAARRWFAHRLPGVATHYSLSGDAVLVSILAGGPDPTMLEAFIQGVVATVPGFDLDTSVAAVPGRRLYLSGATSLAFAGGGGSLYIGQPLAVTAACTAPGVLGVAAYGSGLLSTPKDKVVKAAESGVFPSPARRFGLLVSPPRKESVDAKGRTRAESPGSYPFAPSVVLMAPEQVAAFACPHHGTGAGAAATAHRAVPAALLADIGPVIAHASGTGEAVHLSSADSWSSIFASGVAGTGKSVLVQNLFAFDLLDKTRPSGKPGRPGAKNALIVFESKGADGAAAYDRWAQQIGAAVPVVDIADDTSVAIDLLGSGTAEERASGFVAAMIYAFGENAIQHRSANTLRSVLTLALLATDDDARAVGVDPGSSFLEIADILLCSRGDMLAKNLHTAITARFSTLPDGPAKAELRAALQRAESLYGAGATPSNRRTLVEAPQSKIALLLAVPGFWRPARKRVTFETILARHYSVIVNTGTSLSGKPLPDEEVSKRLSSMLAFTLRRAIQNTCTGWRDQGRSVTIFSDELSLLAGAGPEVIMWWRNQGRSFGVRQVLATQYPEQLHPDVRTAVLSSGTTIWLRQSDPNVIAAAVATLNVDGSAWTDADLAGLEKHHAIIKATVDETPQPAVPAKVAYWGYDGESFARDQGY